MNEKLISAAKEGRLEDVKNLLENGADVHANNDAALRSAAESGHTEVVRVLLEQGADLYVCGDYALRLAAFSGHAGVVKLLLKHGANVHVCNGIALCLAAQNGHAEVVKMLLEHGANVHAENDLALYSAVEDGYIEVVKLLLKADTYIHAKDDLTRLAAKNGHREVVKLLENHIQLVGQIIDVNNTKTNTMKLFGRELTDKEVIGFVRCNANDTEDLIHAAARYLADKLELQMHDSSEDNSDMPEMVCCAKCGKTFNSDLISEYDMTHCTSCGHVLKNPNPEDTASDKYNTCSVNFIVKSMIDKSEKMLKEESEKITKLQEQYPSLEPNWEDYFNLHGGICTLKELLEIEKKNYPFGRCMNTGCGKEFNSELISECEITHCPWCGCPLEDVVDTALGDCGSTAV